MQMIEMGVRHQDHIHRRQIPHMQPWLSYPFQKKQPARKVGVDDDALSSDLQEEAGMPDESDTHLTIGYELGFVGSSRPRCDGGMAHQPGELAGPFAECRIFQRGL